MVEVTMDRLQIKRRSILAAAAFAAAPARPANSRIGVGLIGVGNLGLRHIRERLLPLQRAGEIQVVAASDIYEKAKQRARDLLTLPAGAVHHDYRDLLARRDVDAVVIVTPEHLHHRMAMDALKAGKDIYLEKPMTFTVAEARELEQTVKASGRVLQVGSQYLSDPRYHAAKEVIDRGWIGPVLAVQSGSGSSSLYGTWQYRIEPEATAKTVDWNAFLGPAPRRPFSTDRYFRWRKYWDYSGGIAADGFSHDLSPLLFAVGPRFPVRVSGHGGIHTWKDRETPDTFSMTAEYAGFSAELSWTGAAASLGRVRQKGIVGREALITFVKGGVKVTPDPLFRKKFEKATGKPELTLLREPTDPDEIRMIHLKDFLSAVRSRKQPVYDVSLGYRVMTAICLGVQSYRQGRMMIFDPARETLLDKAPPRPGYEGAGVNYDEPGSPQPDGRLGAD
jgi:predicted dehydrogenase